MEIWKPIGCNPKYEVSNQGSVRRIGKTKPLSLSMSGQKRRYPVVCLYKKDDVKWRHVAHLVLEEFVGPRPEGSLCCHKNDIKTDNRVENLYWGTPKQNGADAVRNGRTASGEKNSNAKLTVAGVDHIRWLLRNEWIQTDIASIFGVTQATISKIAIRKSWK